MEENALFNTALFERPSLIKRLADEFIEAKRELLSNPRQFIETALRSSTSGGTRRRALLRLGLAIGFALYTIAFGAILIFWTVGTKTEPNSLIRPKWIYLGEPPRQQMPNDSKDAGGGGGGGDQTLQPASAGQFADPSLLPPVVAPSPETQVNEPALPFPETVLVDPRILPKQDDLAVTGLPNGVEGPPVAGPGKNDGIGDGEKGGMGPGAGPGVEDGEGWNRGGRRPNLGGDPTAFSSSVRVDERPAALNRPRPNYTEEARKNKVQGTVTARALVGADGTVKRVTIQRGLPDGLNEEAIRAVYQMRFRPARKDGLAVSYWVTLEVEFNLR
jgi:TonB family protein